MNPIPVEEKTTAEYRDEMFPAESEEVKAERELLFTEHAKTSSKARVASFKAQK